MKKNETDGNHGKYGIDGSQEAHRSQASPDSHASPGTHASPEKDRGQRDGDCAAARSSHTSHDSHTSHNSHSSPPRLFPPRGDYRTLLSYQKSEVVYLLTYRFCERFFSRGDRTVDQMVQAARSGKQNIVEGSKAGSTSKEMEIKLTNVARASLEELLEDYRDYLRERGHAIWDKDSKEALYVRELGKRSPVSFETFREFVESRPAEVVANIAICLIHQTNYLLDQRLLRLERDFLKAGGIRERMTRARVHARDEQMRR